MADEPLSDSSPSSPLYVGRQLGVRLCENLGLDPAEVFSLDFHWRPDELPSVTAELRINEGVVRELLILVPKDTASG